MNTNKKMQKEFNRGVYVFSKAPLLINLLYIYNIKKNDSFFNILDQNRRTSNFFLMALLCFAIGKDIESLYFCKKAYEARGYQKPAFKLYMFLLIKLCSLNETGLVEKLLKYNVSTIEENELFWLHSFVYFDINKQKDNLMRLRDSVPSLMAIAQVYWQTRRIINTKAHLYAFVNALSHSSIQHTGKGLEGCRVIVYEVLLNLLREKCKII